MGNYMDVFSQVKAPMGVYSILGNHDYGDYMSWLTGTKRIGERKRRKENIS
jgi:predicted MPP superfamily phosphohydrolase